MPTVPEPPFTIVDSAITREQKSFLIENQRKKITSKTKLLSKGKGLKLLRQGFFGHIMFKVHLHRNIL